MKSQLITVFLLGLAIPVILIFTLAFRVQDCSEIIHKPVIILPVPYP
jgi:hypothetical protein